MSSKLYSNSTNDDEPVLLNDVSIAIKHILCTPVSIFSNIVGFCCRKIGHNWIYNHKSDKIKFFHFTKTICDLQNNFRIVVNNKLCLYI